MLEGPDSIEDDTSSLQKAGRTIQVYRNYTQAKVAAEKLQTAGICFFLE